MTLLMVTTYISSYYWFLGKYPRSDTNSGNYSTLEYRRYSDKYSPTLANLNVRDLAGGRPRYGILLTSEFVPLPQYSECLLPQLSGADD